MAELSITVFHDTRRAKEGDIYPVKIRIYHNYKTQFYATGVSLTKDDFQRTYLSEKPRKEVQKTRDKITFALTRAKQVADEIKPFDFETFRRKYVRPTGAGLNVFYHYDSVINGLRADERVGTASSYELSKKSIQAFLKAAGKNVDTLSFDALTPKFLNDYERWMKKEGKELTTVGIYLRALRRIYNVAIAQKEITSDNYPFKEGGYVIPGSSNVKKALDKGELKKLFTHPLPEDSPMLKARDFWFLSYQGNGINIKDICELRYKNIDKDIISFIRSKTQRTTKGKPVLITIVVTPFIRQIIERYGNKYVNPETYVFPVLSPGMDAEQRRAKVQAFTRFINQHMKKLAKLCKVDEDISVMHARHSFATIAVRGGATIELIQEQLGHTDVATTQNYFKGFTNDIKKELSDKLMNFDE